MNNSLLPVTPTDLLIADQIFSTEVVAKLLREYYLLASHAVRAVHRTSAGYRPGIDKPPMQLGRIAFGKLASEFFRAEVRPLVAKCVGEKFVDWNARRSGFLQYGEGDFMGVHLDGLGCDVVALLYLHVEVGTEAPPHLVLYPEYSGGPALPTSMQLLGRAQEVDLKTGRFVVMRGTRIPHERPPLQTGQSVVAAAGCFSYQVGAAK